MYFKPKKLETLTLSELLQELDPDQISLHLHCISDIRYQKQVALALEPHRLVLLQQMNTGERSDFLLKMGTAFLESGLYEKAQACFYEASKNFEHVQDLNLKNFMRARCHFAYAIVFRELKKDHENANTHLRLSAEILSTVNQQDFRVLKLRTDIFLNRGIFCLTAQNYSFAMIYFGLANISASVGAFPELQHFCLSLSSYSGLAAARAARAVKDNESEKIGLSETAEKCFLDAGEAYHHKILEEKTLETDSQDYMFYLYHHGLLCVVKKDYQNAINYLEYASRICHQCNYEGRQKERLADVLFDLGDAYLKDDNHNLARAALGEAKTIYDDLKNKPKQKAVEDLLEKCPQALSSLRCA